MRAIITFQRRGGKEQFKSRGMIAGEESQKKLEREKGISSTQGEIYIFSCSKGEWKQPLKEGRLRGVGTEEKGEIELFGVGFHWVSRGGLMPLIKKQKKKEIKENGRGRRSIVFVPGSLEVGGEFLLREKGF